MEKLRTGAIGLAMFLAALILYWMNQSEPVQVLPPSVAIPNNPPDIFITDMDTIHYNETGEATMSTQASTVAIYNDTNTSLLGMPVVVLKQNGLDAWRITARSATILPNQNIVFAQEVVTIQLNGSPSLIMATEHLTVNPKDLTVTTDQPIKIVQGKQTLNATGMTVNLDTLEPKIDLHSEVNFQYDPS